MEQSKISLVKSFLSPNTNLLEVGLKNSGQKFTISLAPDSAKPQEIFDRLFVIRRVNSFRVKEASGSEKKANIDYVGFCQTDASFLTIHSQPLQIQEYASGVTYKI